MNSVDSGDEKSHTKPPKPLSCDDQLLDTAQVESAVGVHRSTIRRWEREGIFPARRQIGPRRVGWLRSEVERFMASLPSAAAAS